MAERAPQDTVLEAEIDALGTDVEATVVIGEVQEAGFVNEVTYTPRANITGAATNHRAVTLINKGSDGNGTLVVATLAFDSGINALDFDEKVITLSVVANARVVSPGDVLAWFSSTPGTGIADPGGVVKVTIGRALV